MLQNILHSDWMSEVAKMQKSLKALVFSLPLVPGNRPTTCSSCQKQMPPEKCMMEYCIWYQLFEGDKYCSTGHS